MHLGEQLVQEGLITQAQLDSALKAQLQFGGRLGTNLIELGFVDPDTLARALSRKLGVPPALHRHFASVEPHVIGLFSAKFAERYKAIPLGLTVSTPHRLVVAFMDPVPANLDEVAFGVGRRVEPGVAPELLVLHCLERFYGVKRPNRYIQIDLSEQHQPPQVMPQAPPPAAAAAARMTSPGLAPPYVAHSAAAVQAAMAVTTQPAPTAHVPMPSPAHGIRATTVGHAPPPPGPSPSPPHGIRATTAGLAPPYVAHSAAAVQAAFAVATGAAKVPVEEDGLAPPAWLTAAEVKAKPAEAKAKPAEAKPPEPAPAVVPQTIEVIHARPPAPPDEPATPLPAEALIAQATAGQPAHDAVVAAAMNGAYAPDGTARMPMESIPDENPSAPSTHGVQIGEYDPNIPMLEPYESVIPPAVAVREALSAKDAMAAISTAETKDNIGDAICDYLRSAFGCGLVMILKDEMALGWKGFSKDVDQTIIESIALPMASPSMLKRAFETRSAFKGAPPAEGATLQTRLWKLLRCAPPAEVIVAPIILGKRIVNLVYGHGLGGSLIPAETVADVASVCEAAAAGYTRLIRTGR